MEFLLISLLALAPSPTDGQLYRELETNAAAFALADINEDGRIDAIEFAEYARYRTGVEMPEFVTRKPAGWYDEKNNDVFDPDELYIEFNDEVEV